MGNVNLPTPVVLAGAGLCLLGGYLVGVVAGPPAPDRTTAVVTSYEGPTRKLCLEGEAVSELDGAKDDVICGVWRRTDDAAQPAKGDKFRFVSTMNKGQSGSDDDVITIFGEVSD
ncbi:hypothetical protein [Nocardioides cavernaquae]|uniref:hypothetical protein n=1 Tax=Nocardioides cavernaquae TaxID=2321396 RepID=UPI0011C48870|nr:hypothetical protein [Nocardioides cavernaquae]